MSTAYRVSVGSRYLCLANPFTVIEESTSVGGGIDEYSLIFFLLRGIYCFHHGGDVRITLMMEAARIRKLIGTSDARGIHKSHS